METHQKLKVQKKGSPSRRIPRSHREPKPILMKRKSKFRITIPAARLVIILIRTRLFFLVDTLSASMADKVYQLLIEVKEQTRERERQSKSCNFLLALFLFYYLPSSLYLLYTRIYSIHFVSRNSRLS